MGADAAATAVEALAPHPPVLADAPPAAVDALAALTHVRADTAAATLLAAATDAPMLADAAATAELAPRAHAVVLADTAPRALAALPALVIANPVTRRFARPLNGLLEQRYRGQLRRHNGVPCQRRCCIDRPRAARPPPPALLAACFCERRVVAGEDPLCLRLELFSSFLDGELLLELLNVGLDGLAHLCWHLRWRAHAAARVHVLVGSAKLLRDGTLSRDCHF